MSNIPSSNQVFLLLDQLLRCQSITPKSAGAIELITDLLHKHGFTIEAMDAGEGAQRTSNLWATCQNPNTPPKSSEDILLYAGHIDVVPPGDLENWQTDPFIPHWTDNKVYARGACDMKAGVAALLTCAIATKQKMEDEKFANIPWQIGIVITSDEEGPAKFGTVHVVNELKQRNLHAGCCLLPEPTSIGELGDQIKVGRRGSLTCNLTINGKIGHVAYPKNTANPASAAFVFFNQLQKKYLTNGNELESFISEQIEHWPTTFQIINVHAQSAASNITPPKCEIQLNFRFSINEPPEQIIDHVQAILNQACAHFNCSAEYTWQTAATAYLSKTSSDNQAASMLQIIQAKIKDLYNLTPILSATGGASDGRFLCEICDEVLEIGPTTKTMHQANEYANIADIEKLTKVLCESSFAYLSKNTP